MIENLLYKDICLKKLNIQSFLIKNTDETRNFIHLNLNYNCMNRLINENQKLYCCSTCVKFEYRTRNSRGKAHCNLWELNLVSLYYLNSSIFVFQIEDFLNNIVQYIFLV